MKFAGTWHIYEMEMWGEEYYNMEVQAYFTITKNGSGHFQFGLVRGQLKGKITHRDEGKRLEFTWDGYDECKRDSGRGWIEHINDETIKGEISFIEGDSSLFWAKRK